MGALFGIPGMLWWGAAAAVPILIHLFARQRFKKVRWAAMEFLLLAYKKTQRRIRLEQILLLLLRILALLLLALALADPHFDAGPILGGNDAPRNLVVILDTSFSMNAMESSGGTPFSRARDDALKLVNSLRRDRRDRVTLITAGKPAQLRLKGSEELEQVTAEIDRTPVSAGTTDLVGAFRIAVATLNDLSGTPELYLFSDMQKGGFVPASEPGSKEDPEGEQPQEILASLLREIHSREGLITFVGTPGSAPDNVAISDLRTTSKAIVTGLPTNFSVTVRNFGSRAQGGIVQFFADGSPTPLFESDISQIAPGRSEIIDFRHAFREPGHHSVQARFRSDSLEVDNDRSLVVNVRDRIQVLVVDGDPAREPGEEESFFFDRALSPSDDGSSSAVFNLRTIEETELERTNLDEVNLVVLMNIGLLGERSADSLHRFVESGGGLFITLGDKVRPATLNSHLWRGGRGLLPAEILEPVGVEDRTTEASYELEVRDYDRPPFAYFKDPRIRPFLTLIPFYRFFRAEPPEDDPSVQLLAVFDRAKAELGDPLPALLERRFGEGRVLLFTSSGDQAWNDLPSIYVSYVPLIHEIAYQLVKSQGENENVLVGSPYRKLLSSFAEEVLVSREGQQLKVVRPLPLDDDQGFELTLDAKTLDTPGVYRLALSRGSGTRKAPETLQVAVNVDTEESELRRVDADFLLGAFPDVGLRYANDLDDIDGSNDLRKRDDYWWWMLIACGAILLLETALSQIFSARSGGKKAAA